MRRAVAVEKTETGGWQVRFFDVPIGVINQSDHKFRRLAVPEPADGTV
jgi:putative transposase